MKKSFFADFRLFHRTPKRLLPPLICKDYEIDILFGELAAIVVIANGFFLVWRAIVENKVFFGVVSFLLLVVMPCLYIYSLPTYNFKLAKWTCRSWNLCILLLCLSVTDEVLKDFSGFWKIILPAAIMSTCMTIGLLGVIRIKDPNQLKQYIKALLSNCLIRKTL